MAILIEPRLTCLGERVSPVCKFFMYKYFSKKGFTLLELLIAIAILAVLGLILFLTINPGELLKKSRDAQRMSDLSTINTAISLYKVNISVPKMAGIDNVGCKGTVNSTDWQPTDYIYYSYPNDAPGSVISGKNFDGMTFTTGGPHQVTQESSGLINGLGWLPINFTKIIGNSPISNLPIDPVNKIADPTQPNDKDLVYRYICLENNLKYEINATLESQAYTVSDNKMANDGGNNANYYEVGTDLNIFNREDSGVIANCDTSLPLTFIDSNIFSFNLGNFSQTIFSSVDSSLILDTSGISSGSGSYLSAFKNNKNANWTDISWIPLSPYGKPLPSNKQAETAYSYGNVNMAGNVLLLHADESSGSTVFSDSSGSNNNGSCSLNCPKSDVGKVNGGLVFKGTSSVITTMVVPNSSSLNPSQITLEAWVKWNINPSLGLPWSSIINKNLDAQYRLHHSSNNSKFEFAIGMNYVTSSTTPQIDKWYHLVGTYNGSIIRLYINGVEESNKLYSSAIPVSSAPLYVGSRSDNARTFNGSIDEVAVYNRALGNAEILDHYNRGAMRLKVKVRACSDQACAGVNFVGPDGTINSYFNDNGSSLGLPSYSISGLSGNYFQYQTILETDSSSSPKLSGITINSHCSN